MKAAPPPAVHILPQTITQLDKSRTKAFNDHLSTGSHRILTQTGVGRLKVGENRLELSGTDNAARRRRRYP